MNDELLFGTEPQRRRDVDSDGDGDGVSDAQEAIDGTDPNDAASSIRHDGPVARPTTGDPRDDPNRRTLESEVKIDVAAANPSGQSLEQALPTGLDGKPIQTTHHYGNADADKLMGGRGNENSPLNMDRNPMAAGKPAAGPKAGHDPLKDTLGRDPGPSAGGPAKSGGGHHTPPPGAELSFRAPNMGLVSNDDLRALVGVAPEAKPAAKEDPKEKFIKASDQKSNAEKQAEWEKKTKPKDYDTGEGSGTITVTEEGIRHIVDVRDGATDTVEGYGTGPQIEGNAPPLAKGDLVKNPNPDDDGKNAVDISTVTVKPPGGFFTDPTNPKDGFGPPQQPGTGSGGGGGGNTGREGFSSAATAADSSSDKSDTSGGVTVVGGGSTGSGIHTIASDDGTGETGTGGADSSDRAWQSSSTTADDSNLDQAHVEVARSTARNVDSDGDGVSDAQEAIDGTDPDDATDSIRHDGPVAGPTTGDPRGDPNQPTHELDVNIDVAAANASGLSLEQALPTGLDGTTIQTTHHYGNADADKLMGGRGNENSPLDAERNPTAGSLAARGGEHGLKPPSGVGGNRSSGGIGTPPPGTELNFNAPNMSLVGDSADGGTPVFVPPEPPKSAEEKVKDRDSNKENRDYDKWKKEQQGKDVNPDADDSTVGVPTDEQLARAVAVHQGTIHVVEGVDGGPQIEGDAPPPPEGDLVTDRNPDADQFADAPTGTVNIPGGTFTDPTNPRDGFGPPQQPGTGSGGGGGGNTGREGFSYAATAAADSSTDSAADSSIDSSGDSSDLKVVGSGSTGSGIQTVAGDDVTGMGMPIGTDNSGRESQSSAMMAGDDDDLEELQVEMAYRTAPASSRIDNDGDGVSDAQEAIDGTDPDDGASSIRHDGPVAGPTTGDPRGDPNQPTHELDVNIDVAAANASGLSLEHALPTGLDGRPIQTTHHYGNADADKLMGGRGNENSPLNMTRDVTTVGRPASGGTGTGSSAGGPLLGMGAPNKALVGEGDEGDFDLPMPFVAPPTPPLTEPSDPPPPPSEGERNPPTPPDQPEPEPKPVQVQTDPDADTGGGGGVLGFRPEPRVVEGVDGGPQIEGDAPPPPEGDLVTDRNPDADQFADAPTGTVNIPGGGFTDPTNPRDGFGPPQQPGSGSGGDTGGNTEREGFSYAATAADSSSDSSTDSSTDSSGGSSDLKVVGSGSTGSGIQTVAGDDVTGMGTTAPPDSSDRGSENSAMMASGAGTQTEDEIYIDVTAAPADASGGESGDGSPGSNEVPEPDVPPAPTGMVADVIVPVLEIHVVDGGAPAPLDNGGGDIGSGIIIPDVGIIIPDTDLPVMSDGFAVALDPIADAMTTGHVGLDAAPTESFAGLQIDDAVAIPPEVDLDDGF